MTAVVPVRVLWDCKGVAHREARVEYLVEFAGAGAAGIGFADMDYIGAGEGVQRLVGVGVHLWPGPDEDVGCVASYGAQRIECLD